MGFAIFLNPTRDLRSRWDGIDMKEGPP